jgi:hypothetical protein
MREGKWSALPESHRDGVASVPERHGAPRTWRSTLAVHQDRVPIVRESSDIAKTERAFGDAIPTLARPDFDLRSPIIGHNEESPVRSRIGENEVLWGTVEQPGILLPPEDPKGVDFSGPEGSGDEQLCPAGYPGKP